MDEVGGIIGIGVAIKDHTGFVLASCSLNLAGCFDAIMAETLAIYKALVFSKDCGLFPCMLESDAAVVVSRINVGSHLDSSSGIILSKIATLISVLSVRSVSHVPR